LLRPGYSSDELAGILEMSLIYFNQDGRFNLGTIPSVLAFDIGILPGILHATTVTDVEVQAAL